MNQDQARVYCAVWTPFDEKMEVDEKVLRSILEFVLEQKVQGVMALGSTGEFLQLSTAQRKETLRIIRRSIGSRPVIANVSHVQWRETVELGLHAKELGAEMIALLPPWFYPMPQNDVAEFFVRTAEAVGLPLAIYNFPEMTGKRVDAETIRAVARRVPVRAVKQSGGDFAYHGELGELARELGFVLFTGADTHFIEAAEMGASGIVSGLANALPEVVMRSYEAVRTGNVESIARERGFLAEMAKFLGRVAFPLNVKAAMEARGMATGELKSPVSEETRREYEELVRDLRNLYSGARVF